MAGNSSEPALHHLVEAVHTGGGLLGDAEHVLRPCGASDGRRRRARRAAARGRPRTPRCRRSTGRAPRRRCSNSTPLCTSERGVTTVVEDHVRAVLPVPSAGHDSALLGAPPVLLERLALPGEHRDAGGGDRGRGVVLGGEDVARRPAHLGAERDQRLDEHRGLDGHVQRAGDARAGERLGLAVALAQGHEAGHLVLGELDLLAAELGEREIGDLEVGRLGRGGRINGGRQRRDSFIRVDHQVASPGGERDVGVGPDHRMTA